MEREGVRQASGAQKNLFQDETDLKQIACRLAWQGRSGYAINTKGSSF